jgi:hypothetical protein
MEIAVSLIRLLCVCVFAAFVTGCAAPPPLGFSVPNVGYSTKKLDAEVRSTTVTLARENEKKGDLPFGSETLPQLWKDALEEALNKMAIFKDDSKRKLSLSVKILAINIPSFGGEFKTNSIARYELIDRSNGDIVYTQDISTDGVVPANYAFLGAARARESVNRSIVNNISQFLQALQTVDVSKPMFPAAVAN